MHTELQVDGTPRLIFDELAWQPSRWRLGWFLLISLVGHLGVFYLFKVTTPLTTKRLPPEQSVLILRGSDPACAQVLASLEDRSPASMLVSLTAPNEEHWPQLALPAYTPSYQGYEPDYHFNWDVPHHPEPLLAEARSPLLPRWLPARPRPAPQLTPSSPHRLLLGPALAARPLAQPILWPPDLPAAEDATEPYLFRIAIDPSGRVKYCLSDGPTPPPALLQAIQALHFQPQPGTDLCWDTIEIH